MQSVVYQLTALEKPMLKFFGEQKTGTEFAKFVEENFGREAIATVASVPRPTLLNMLSQYPPVWNVVGPRIQDFAKFLDEFLTFHTSQTGPVQ
jgi:hypothetical protein